MKIADFDLLDLNFLLMSYLTVEIILGMDVLTSHGSCLKTAECFLEGQLISEPKLTELQYRKGSMNQPTVSLGIRRLTPFVWLMHVQTAVGPILIPKT